MKRMLFAVGGILALTVGVVIGWSLWSLDVANRVSSESEVTQTPVAASSKPETRPASSASATSGTFAAPTGAGDHAGTEGPWARRVLGAYSDDGLTWTKTNEIISDQADVPSLAVDADGTLYMYYYGWTVGTKQNVPAVATSVDDGKTWVFHYLKFTGFPERGDVSDPDVLFEDGVFRIYGTTRGGGHARISYGEGTDGISFTYKGVAFQPDDADAGVASVYRVADGWRLYSLASLGVADSGTEVGQHWFASSVDGASFTLEDEVFFRVDGKPYFQGNVISVPGGHRAYVFTDGSEGIYSWFSADGEAWTLEEGVRLIVDVSTGLEKGYVGDPDVILLPDGRYFMAYATLIP